MQTKTVLSVHVHKVKVHTNKTRWIAFLTQAVFCLRKAIVTSFDCRNKKTILLDGCDFVDLQWLRSFCWKENCVHTILFRPFGLFQGSPSPAASKTAIIVRDTRVCFCRIGKSRECVVVSRHTAVDAGGQWFWFLLNGALVLGTSVHCYIIAAFGASLYLRLLMSHTTYTSHAITAYPDISGWYLGVFYYPAAWRQRCSRSVNSEATAQL